MTETTAIGKPKVERDEHGRLLPGSVLNPGGTPKASYKALKDITEAIEEYEIEHGVSYWKAATLIAMRLADKGNTTLISKILDKFIGSKVEIDGDIIGSGETRIIIVRADGQANKAKELPGSLPIQR